MILFNNDDFDGVLDKEQPPKYNGDKPSFPVRDFMLEKKSAKVLNDENNNKADAACGSQDEKNFNLEYMAKYGTDLSFRRKVVWTNAIGFLVLHLAGVYGIYLSFTEAKLLTTIWSKYLNVFILLLLGVYL